MKNIFPFFFLYMFPYLLLAQQLDSIQSVQKNDQIFHYQQVVSLQLPALLVGTLAAKYERRVNQRLSLVARGGMIGVLPGRELQLGLGSSWKPGWKEEYEGPGGYISDSGESYEGFSVRRRVQTKDKGFFLRIGPKWKFKKGDKFLGFYVHPSLFYTRFSFDREQFNSFTLADGSSPKPNNPEHWTDDFSMSSAGLLVSIGLQLQLAKRIVLDSNLGLGPAYHGIHVKREYHTPFAGGPMTKEFTREVYEAIWYTHFSSGVKVDAAIHLGFSVGIAL